MSEPAVGSADHLRHAGRLLWPNLPVLLVGSLVVALGWSVVRVLPPQLGWLAVLGVGLVVVPAFAALLGGCQVLLTDEHFGIKDLLVSLVRGYPAALRVTALPTTTVLLTLVAVQLWLVSGQNWLLVSISVGASISVVALYAGVIALPYVLRTRSRLVEGWLVSLYVAGRNPVPVLAVLSAVALAVWAAAYLSFALVLLLPAPLALVWAAAVAVATDRSRARLPSDA